MSGNHLIELAHDVVKQALDAGATDAECTVAEGEEFSANVRMRELESLKQAGSRGLGVRVLVGRRAGSSSTSDLSREGIERLVRSALDLAGVTNEDPCAGLPEAEELGSLAGDLRLASPDVASLDTVLKIETARRAESAALDADPRIFNSEGASFDSHLGRHIFVNSRGFAGEYRTSYCSLSACGARWRIHGARLLGFAGARLQRAGKTGAGGPRRCYACLAPPPSSEGKHAEGPRGV
jgi:PmbA protein